MTPRPSKSTKIILIVEFVLLSYMLYVLSTSLFKSHQVERFIKIAEEENAALEKMNSSLAEDYQYYSSDAYREKIAKQNFGLIRPGEEVIVITPDTASSGDELDVTAQATKRYYEKLSNTRKWFLFFLDKKRFLQ